MKTVITSTFLFILYTDIAHAYIGIAALLPIFGQAVIFLIVFLLAVAGLLFYPVKSLITKISKKKVKNIDKRKP